MNADSVNCADPGQWAQELESHRKYLLKVARALVSDVASAEDVVQETLLAALHGAHRFERRASVRTWLTVILKRKVLDLLRACQRAPVPLTQLPGAAQEGDSSRIFDENGTWLNAPLFWNHPEQALTQSDFMNVFETCLSRLPRSAARAFVLRAVLEADTDEVAASLGLSANHLGVMLYRARMALRECLSMNWFSKDTRS